MAKRRRPLTRFEERRLAKRQQIAELLADGLPADRDEWRRIVTERFGPEAGKFADAVFPNRDELEELLGSEMMTTFLDSVERRRE